MQFFESIDVEELDEMEFESVEKECVATSKSRWTYKLDKEEYLLQYPLVLVPEERYRGDNIRFRDSATTRVACMKTIEAFIEL